MKRTELADRIEELERKLLIAEASQIHRHHFADMAIGKATNCMGLGVILSITKLDGTPLFDPVMISNGLSESTVAALREDLVRSFHYATELKPKGAA